MKLASRKNLVSTLALAGTLAAGIFAGRVLADQPHMQAALDALHRADKELDMAVPDKGGHRAKAIELVRHAMEQVEKGIEYDRHR